MLHDVNDDTHATRLIPDLTLSLGFDETHADFVRRLAQYKAGLAGPRGATERRKAELLAIADKQTQTWDSISRSGGHRLVQEQMKVWLDDVRAALGDAPALVEFGWDERGKAEGLDHADVDVPAALAFAAEAPLSSHPVDVDTVIDDEPVFIAGVEPGADPAAVVAAISAHLKRSA